jgi:hypothetical protein
MLDNRCLGIALAVSLAALSNGCSKKDKTEASGSTTTASTAAAVEGTTADPSGAGTANKKNWEKIERVSFAKLQSLLPDAAIGMKRTGLNGNTVPNGEGTYTEGIGENEGPNETSLELKIQDFPTEAEALLGSKSTTYKGFPVANERESNDESSTQLIVGERFVVTASGHKVKVAQLKTALDKVDLAKLATWKDEGLKK